MFYMQIIIFYNFVRFEMKSSVYENQDYNFWHPKSKDRGINKFDDVVKIYDLNTSLAYFPLWAHFLVNSNKSRALLDFLELMKVSTSNAYLRSDKS